MAERDVEALGWLDDFVGFIRVLHDHVLELSPGLSGEHSAKLEAACARSFQSAFGEFLFQSPYEMAAALFHGIICDHAFVDGNKRTGSIAGLWLLLALVQNVPEPTTIQVRFLGELAVETASGGLDVHDVAFWLERIFAPPERTEAHERST